MIEAGEILTKLGFAVDDKGAKQYNKTLDQTEKHSKKAEVGSIALGTALGHLAAKAGQAALQIATKLVGALKDSVTEFARTGDQIAKTSRNLGVSSEAYQKLSFAAKRAGVDQGVLDGSLRKLGITLSQAIEKPGGKASQTLERLGLSAEELAGMDADKRLGAIGDALKNIDSPGQRATISTQIFGRNAGPELNKLLMGGSTAIDAYGNRLEQLGGIMSDEALSSAETLSDSFTDLQTVLSGASNTLAAALAPALSDVVDQLVEFIAENKDFIEQDLAGILATLAQATLDLLPFIVDTVKGFRDFYAESKQLGDYLSNTFPVATELTGFAFKALADPVGAINRLLTVTIDRIDEVLNSGGRLRKFAESLGIVSAASEGGGRLDFLDTYRGFREGRFNEDQSGAQARIVSITEDRSAKDLAIIAADPRRTKAEQDRARALLGPALARENLEKANAARGRAKSNAEALAQIVDDVSEAPARRSGRSRKSASGKTSEAELMGTSQDGNVVFDLADGIQGTSLRSAMAGAKVVRFQFEPRLTFNTSVEGVVTGPPSAFVQAVSGGFRSEWDRLIEEAFAQFQTAAS